MTGRWSALLALLNLLLLGSLLWVWSDAQALRWMPPPAMAPNPAQFAAPPGVEPAMAEIEQLHQRPLFVRGRRPAAEDPAAAQPAAQAEPAGLELASLVGLVGDADQGVALVAQGGKTQRVPVGGRLSGQLSDWQLVAIDGLSAVFADSAGERRSLPIATRDDTAEAATAGGTGSPQRRAARRQALPRR